MNTFVYIIVPLAVILQTTDCEGDTSRIVSKGQRFLVREGDSARLPCHTINQGISVITWTWGNKLISAGNVKVMNDERLMLVSEGRELVLRNLTRLDTGQLTCTLNLKNNPVNINHTIEILVPPTVSISPYSSVLNYTAGQRLELYCDAEGYPRPSVKWTRQGRASPIITSKELEIPSVNKDDQGVYVCTGENTEGEVSKSFTLNIHYKPLIKLGRVSPQSRSGSMFSLSCSVEANPPAEVSWYKDGKYLRTESLRDMKQSAGDSASSHQLTVKSVDDTEYGNYTCRAENAVGTSEEYIEIKGQPDQPVVTSQDQSEGQTYYMLSWKVWTPPTLPILNQSILYRLKRKANGEPVSEVEGTWHNLALISNSGNAIFGQDQEEYSMDLNSLSKDAEYEVRIRAMNKQGWSQLSEPFFFRTAGSEYKYQMPAYTKKQLLSASAAQQGREFSRYTMWVSLLMCAICSLEWVNS